MHGYSNLHIATIRSSSTFAEEAVMNGQYNPPRLTEIDKLVTFSFPTRDLALDHTHFDAHWLQLY